MNKEKTQKSIDRVTVTNLDIALRMCHIEINKSILDKVIDLVELIEEKGQDVSIQDICELEASWKSLGAMKGGE
jgi:uncharacterized protein YnzC (UPF0291/DUF896 family)